MHGRTQILAALDGQRVREFSEALRDVVQKVSFATEFESAFGYEPGYAWWPATDTGVGGFCAGIPDLVDGVLRPAGVPVPAGPPAGTTPTGLLAPTVRQAQQSPPQGAARSHQLK
jgi:hypothetical protein